MDTVSTPVRRFLRTNQELLTNIKTYKLLQYTSKSILGLACALSVALSVGYTWRFTESTYLRFEPRCEANYSLYAAKCEQLEEYKANPLPILTARFLGAMLFYSLALVGGGFAWKSLILRQRLDTLSSQSITLAIEYCEQAKSLPATLSSEEQRLINSCLCQYPALSQFAFTEEEIQVSYEQNLLSGAKSLMDIAFTHNLSNQYYLE